MNPSVYKYQGRERDAIFSTPALSLSPSLLQQGQFLEKEWPIACLFFWWRSSLVLDSRTLDLHPSWWVLYYFLVFPWLFWVIYLVWGSIGCTRKNFNERLWSFLANSPVVPHRIVTWFWVIVCQKWCQLFPNITEWSTPWNGWPRSVPSITFWRRCSCCSCLKDSNRLGLCCKGYTFRSLPLLRGESSSLWTCSFVECFAR